MLVTISNITHSNEKGKKCAIYTISVFNNLIATGGQDGYVKLWQNEKLMSTLTAHDGAVLCVRWSSSGLLASGSDDTKIIIWIKVPGSSQSLTGFNEITYRQHKLLIGHQSDIADIAWSPDNLHIASCAFDSTIFIWSTKTFDRIRKLDSHSGFVKGLTWDPMGLFLASQSDDKTMIIFKTSDWSIEKIISDPFEDAAATTFFRRNSWSPDGACIVSSNGESGGLATAPIISRDSFISDTSLMGHHAPVEVALFNPVMFRLGSEFDNKVTSVCALGSQDCGISIWWTSVSRSPCALANLFEHSVLDLAWSSNGKELYACSYDGTVQIITFDNSDLGTPMTQAQQEEIIKSSGYKTRDNVLVEDPIQLLYEQKTDLVQQRRSEKPEIVDTIMADANVVIPVSSDAAPEISFISQGPTPEQVAANQKISKNSDGKKRIAPFFVKSLGEDPVEPVSKISLRSTLKRPLEPNELSDIQYILPTIVKNANSPDQIIGIPTIQSKLSTHITVTSNRITKLFNIECSNTKKSSRIFVTLSKELVWEDCLPHPILFITGTEKFIIATCINGYTFFYSSAGRRLLPALKLNGVVSFIDVFQYLALIITNNGDLYTFDLKTCKNIINRENVLCFLSKNVDIVSASIFESVIKITLSDNRVFSFHQEMQSWIDISKSNQIDRALPMLKNGIESMSLIVKMQEIADIENEICCMLYNRDGNNFKELYLLYAQKLADESQHSKIVEVCEEFMNGGDILGNDRIELLRSFLEIFSTNRNLQQIVKLYHDELDGRRKCY